MDSVLQGEGAESFDSTRQPVTADAMAAGESVTEAQAAPGAPMAPEAQDAPEAATPEAEGAAVDPVVPARGYWGKVKISSRQVASKWVKTSVLRQDARVAAHIPETRIFSRGSLESMLDRYGRVVMKPVVGTGGIGVIMIIKSASGYTVRHRRRTTRHATFDAMMAKVRAIKRKRSYLVQRGIELATIGGRPIDYRVKVVKQRGRWVTRAMVGRLANRGLFVTNLCRGGKQLSAAAGISRSLSASQVGAKKSEMRSITRTCIELLERHFPGVSQLGFDYGFDRSGRLWIFEVNTRPH